MVTRRDFLQKSAAGACALGVSTVPALGETMKTASIPMRTLGKTGEKVSILGIGGWHVGALPSDQKAVQIIRKGIDEGITFMDNAWEYHEGLSEKRMGKALKNGYREKAFLMTKHHGRDKKTAMRHLEDSLRRLNTDVIDLWQFHEIIYQDDPKEIFAQNGGIEAAVQAKKEGKVRFIGFTGHKDPELFLEMLNHDFEWDAVQMPVNVLDQHYVSFQKHILPLLQERNIGSIAMKSLAGGHLLRTPISAREALRYTWSQPVATVVSGITSEEVLMENIGSARNFTPLSSDEEKALLERARPLAKGGEFEPFKTSRAFDGPTGREQHGI